MTPPPMLQQLVHLAEQHTTLRGESRGAVMIPFTFPVAHGIGCGFLGYVAVKLLTGRVRELHWLMAAAAARFEAHFLCAESR